MGDFACSLQLCHTLGAGVISLSESNVNWNQSYLLGKVHQTARAVWQTTAIQHSQHPDMILKGKGERAVAIITAYRVCKSTFDSAGDTTCYMQQLRTLLAYNNSISRQQTPDPHRQFVLDLQSWITMLRRQNISIILSLDGNENLIDKQGSFYPLEYKEESFPYAPNHDGSLATLAATCKLIDVLAHFHPPPYPSTYARGKNRLDYIFMPDDIIHAASRSGILPLYSVFLGDHNACYVDIDAALLFTDSTYQIAPPLRRGLQLHDPRKVTAYNKELIDQLKYHKIFHKVDDIYEISGTGTWTSQHIDLYEKKRYLNLRFYATS